MAKGAQAKIQVMNKLMEVFDGAFLYNDGKEIRILPHSVIISVLNIYIWVITHYKCFITQIWNS